MSRATGLCLSLVMGLGLSLAAAPAEAALGHFIEGAIVYLFDGDLRDQSGNGNTGTTDGSGFGRGTGGAVSFSSAFLPPCAGCNYPGNQSVLFNGDTAVMAAPDASHHLGNVNSWSYESWVYPTDQSTESVFLRKGNANGRGNFQTRPDQSLRQIWLDGDGDPVEYRSGHVLQDNTWTHLAWVMDTSVNKLLFYVNGVVEGDAVIREDSAGSAAGSGSNDISALDDYDADLPDVNVPCIGAFCQAAGFANTFTGYMDEARLILRALSPEEVARDATNHLPEPASLALLGGLGLVLLRRRGR